MGAKSGRHVPRIPGPTNVPDRLPRAISFPTIDHRGPEFHRLGRQVIEGLQKIFKTNGTVVVFPPLVGHREACGQVVDALMRTGAETVVTTCPGCMLHLANGLFHAKSRARVVHLAEALATSYREDGRTQ